MIEDRWNERQAILVVDVVSNDSINGNAFSDACKGRCVSSVTNETNAEANDVEGCGDTHNSPPSAPTELPIPAVDWSTLTILENTDEDGLATQLVVEDHVYEAMGFKEVGEIADEVAREEDAIPGILKLLEKKLLFQAFLQS